ncbi:cell surface glycoprotein MUC18 [Pogona vitticeps]
MARGGRLGRFALGCLCCLVLATGGPGGRGGVSGEGEVAMPEVVEVEMGKTALIPCQFSLPENGSYAYIHWHSFDKTQRKLIISMIRDREQNTDPKLKDRLSILANFSLEIRQVALQDAKVYICQVGLGSAGVAENRTTLRVSKAPEPPVIQKTDTGITASDSEKYEIAKCISRNSYPASTITWYKDEEPLTENGKDIEIRPMHIMESSGLYTVQSTLLAQVTKDDRHAIFHCQVDYSLMGAKQTIVSKNFTINIHYPSEEISFVINASRPVVKEGDSVTLHCKADGNPPPEYTLVKLQDGEEEPLSDVSGGKVVLRDVDRNQSGSYLCKVLDLQSFAELNASVNLFVNYLDVPTVRIVAVDAEKQQRKHTPREGDTLLLSCNTTSSGPVEFQWEKKGEVISTDHLLKLTKVTYQDMGEYTCRVTMPEVPGLSRSKVASVVIHSKPKLTTPEGVVYIKEGEVLNLTCSVFSVQKPKFFWSAKNITSHPLSSRNHQHNSTISIQVTEALLASGINCSAENKLGTTEHQFMLELRPAATKPGVPDSDEMLKPKESNGVIIVAVIVCIMVVSILGAVLYFLHKKGKLACGRSGKQEITRPDAHKDEIVVEVKSDKAPEEAGLLQGANGEKKSTGDQGEEYINLRN